jgi:intracellular sulfur oxidation DsrE/DsrF family protein
LRAEHPNLALVACGQTVERLREKGIEVRLLPGTRVASSALDQIVTRMGQGWSYVRI